MDLRKENDTIKRDAEYTLNECENRADEMHLERVYVVEQFIKEFNKLSRERDYTK